MYIEKCTYDVRAYLPGCVDTEFINIGVTPKQECIQYNPSTGIISYKPTKKSVQCVIMIHVHGDEEIRDFFFAYNEADPETVTSEGYAIFDM